MIQQVEAHEPDLSGSDVRTRAPTHLDSARDTEEDITMDEALRELLEEIVSAEHTGDTLRACEKYAERTGTGPIHVVERPGGWESYAWPWEPEYAEGRPR
jgi:hypothetical protein